MTDRDDRHYEGRNRLGEEKSPYLLMHAKNPVHWFPWGPDAFEEAKRRDVPIFLSIGYATCHWCHVMERESFENPQTARILNQHFVSIKLDREERPDVDQLYMRAIQALGQNGGWPLSIFLTPDRKPFTGGTYFPPVRRGQMPGFPDVLETVRGFWKKNRDQVLESAGSIEEFLKNTARDFAKPGDSFDVEEMFSKTCQVFQGAFDGDHGGFLMNGENKFPPSMALSFLMGQFETGRFAEGLPMVTTTLREMLRGGIYDMVGGGLARYSTDHRWLVPHFEKMLYDNALFARNLVEAWRITGEELFRTSFLEIATFLEREMGSPEGGFYSALDADQEGGEGAFYLWEKKEFLETLSPLDPEVAGAIADYCSVTSGGNFEGKNILQRARDPEPFRLKSGLDQTGWDQALGKARDLLLEKRSQRPRPFLDDKILLSWNAMTISALTIAARNFERPELHERALKATDFILNNMARPTGGFYRRYRDGEAAIPAGLADLALFGQALLDLYRTDFNSDHLERALQIARGIPHEFDGKDGGFLFDSPLSSGDLEIRLSDTYDGVEPSGNGAALAFFHDLTGFGYDEFYPIVDRIVHNLTPSFQRERGYAHPWFLTTLTHMHSDPIQLAIMKESDEEAIPIQSIRRLVPDRTPIAVGKVGDPVLSPLLENRGVVTGAKVTYYLCRNGSCSLPVTNDDEILKSLEFNRFKAGG